MTLLNRKYDPYGSMGAILEAKEGISGRLSGRLSWRTLPEGMGVENTIYGGRGVCSDPNGDLVPLQGVLLGILRWPVPPPPPRRIKKGEDSV